MPKRDDEQSARADFPQQTDVLVVGAGPTGLSLACGLARRGIDHVVIDHAPGVAPNSQSTVVDALTLEALEGIGAAERLIRRGLPVTHFALRDRDDVLFTVDFSALPIKHPYTLMVPECVAESILSERYASYGCSVFRPVTAVALQQSAEGVTVNLWDGNTSRSGGPARRSIFARYVVGCDGMHSQVRGALQIPFVGSSRTESFVIADVRLRYSLPRTEVQLFFSKEGLLIVAPLPDERYRILASVDRTEEIPSIDEVQKLLTARGPQSAPALVQDMVWSAGIKVHHRLAMHYRSGRVFLAGDAAHVHSPAGGQGMNAGIQDALFLAGKLADVLSLGADVSVLGDYEKERRPVALTVLRITERLAGVATLRGEAGQKFRNRLMRALGRLPAFRRALAARLSGFAGSKRSLAVPNEKRRLLLTALILAALVGFVLFASVER